METVTLTLTAADPFIATEVRLTEQTVAAGAPPQLIATDWLKPPSGETRNWNWRIVRARRSWNPSRLARLKKS